MFPVKSKYIFEWFKKFIPTLSNLKARNLRHYVECSMCGVGKEMWNIYLENDLPHSKLSRGWELTRDRGMQVENGNIG